MTKILFKPLFYFFLAALSLLIAGLAVNPQQSLLDWTYLIWSTITGIFITYRFNDFIDQSENFKFNVKLFFENNLHRIVIIQFVLILLPISLYHLSIFRIFLLGVMLFLGLLYSLKIGDFRLKHVFIVKNLLIGICWGSLVLIGSNNISEPVSITLFIFSTIQVFIGSSIRDLNDIDQDSLEYVRSIPIVLGFRKSIILFHLLNILSVLVSLAILGNSRFIIGVSITYLWRLLVLIKVNSNSQNLLWSQRMNLMTCTSILIGVFISCLF